MKFIDLVGSTTLSQQLDPEDYHARVVAYQTACQQVIARYEGHIAQYLGDGVLAATASTSMSSFFRSLGSHHRGQTAVSAPHREPAATLKHIDSLLQDFVKRDRRTSRPLYPSPGPIQGEM